MRDYSLAARSIFLCFLLGAGLAGSTRAAAVKVANLRDLMQQAERIFVGRCVAIESGLSGNVPYTTYTFEVSDRLKGVSDPTVKVRQFGLREPAPVNEILTRAAAIQGMPHYERGKKYLLFLIGESPIGLSSPAGLFQGAFVLKGDHFVNSVNNRNLARNLSVSWLQDKGLADAQVERLLRLREGAIEARFFLDVVRRISSDGAESPSRREPR